MQDWLYHTELFVKNTAYRLVLMYAWISTHTYIYITSQGIYIYSKARLNMHHWIIHPQSQQVSISLSLSPLLPLPRNQEQWKEMRMTRDGKDQEYKKGLWTVEEDKILMDYVRTHGQGHWNRIAKKTGPFTLSLSLPFSLLFLFLVREKKNSKGDRNDLDDNLGLKRCGKSCRLRWMNYLSPSVNRGNFTDQEEDLIIRLHKLLGNRFF